MTDAAVQSTDQLVTCDSRHDSVAVATTRRRQQVDKATNTDDNWLFSLSADVAADDEPLMSVRDNIATFPLGPFLCLHLLLGTLYLKRQRGERSEVQCGKVNKCPVQFAHIRSIDTLSTFKRH